MARGSAFISCITDYLRFFIHCSAIIWKRLAQYLMGRSYICVTMGTYTHPGLEDGGRGGRNEPDAAAGKRQEGAGGAKRKDG